MSKIREDYVSLILGTDNFARSSSGTRIVRNTIISETITEAKDGRVIISTVAGRVTTITIIESK